MPGIRILVLPIALLFCGFVYFSIGQRSAFQQSLRQSFQLATNMAPLEKPLSQIITGLYANDTVESQILIHDIDGVASWIWSAEDAKDQNLSIELRACIERGLSTPDSKWANNGTSVVSVFNYAALVINHLPGDPLDKKITFGVCLDRFNLDNSHTLELVPGGKLAVATTSNDREANIKVFDLSSGLKHDSSPVQEFGFISAVHGLLWDRQDKLLWAVGSYNPPNQKAESQGAIAAYKYLGGSFQNEPVHIYNISTPKSLGTEWEGTDGETWWEGGHELFGMPNQRTLLVATDTDLHAFSVDTKTFEAGEQVAEKYLSGFEAVGDRVGSNDESLPRSDVKCISIDGNNNILYVQAGWGSWAANSVNLIRKGKLQLTMEYPNLLYRSRWFADIPGWPKASFRRF